MGDSQATADILAEEEHHTIRRQGRFLIVELRGAHRVLSTSACGGGQRQDLRYLVNHQSCEGSGHEARFLHMRRLGQAEYHRQTCAELGLDPEEVALMGTAANVNYAALAVEAFAELRVCALVTAGVEGNAGRAGDPARWHEGEEGWVRAGTINILLLLNWPLTPAALARAAATLTEAKSAALQELAIASRYSRELATGTGTDQYGIAAPLDESRAPKTDAGHHAKLGELIGRAVRRATLEALRWQNGLEPSYTRSILHALGRFGLDEARFAAAMRARLDGECLALLEKNRRAVLYEPQVAAAAYAYAAVWDRMRHGALPAAQAGAVLRQQAAVLASSLAARPQSWPLCWQELRVDPEEPLEALCDALALGWRLKWS